jgi:hypothetical protein
MEGIERKILNGIPWFGAGFAFALVLMVGLRAARFVPASIALGLLCFTCGVLVMQFLALRKAEKDSRAAEDYWLEEFNKLEGEKSEWEKGKLEWELKKQAWEAEKDAAVRKEAMRLLVEQATIDDDTADK